MPPLSYAKRIYILPNIYSLSSSGFLSLNTIDILGQMPFFVVEGCPVQCKILNSIPGLYSLDVSSRNTCTRARTRAHTHTHTHTHTCNMQKRKEEKFPDLPYILWVTKSLLLRTTDLVIPCCSFFFFHSFLFLLIYFITVCLYMLIHLLEGPPITFPSGFGSGSLLEPPCSVSNQQVRPA